MLGVALVALVATAPAAAAAKGPTPRGEVKRLAASGAIDAKEAKRYRDGYDAAQKTLKQLKGYRNTQLRAVVLNVNRAAADHRFSATRLPALFLTLERNRAWWRSQPIPYRGRRVTFPPSQVVWQFYPGQGWQIQWLATFGKANALWMVKDRDDDLRRLLDEALGLAARRAGGIAFEYLFPFDGGEPPWVSGLAQGTALSALARGAIRLDEPKYIKAARTALGIFKTPPPVGIRRRTAEGAHYLQYSYAPRLRIVNGFTQSLNGLYDFATLANDAEGRRLFDQGQTELHHELPQFDTGAWSLYSKAGRKDTESDLSYHKVLRNFLQGLCDRLTRAGKPSPKLYCRTARRFTVDLRTKPKLKVKVPKKAARVKTTATIRLTVDKVSTISVTASRRGKVIFRYGARLGRGRHEVELTPSESGPLLVRARAVDLAGNATAAHTTLHVAPRPKKHKGV